VTGENWNKILGLTALQCCRADNYTTEVVIISYRRRGKVYDRHLSDEERSVCGALKGESILTRVVVPGELDGSF
jgi:hypothetical protein